LAVIWDPTITAGIGQFAVIQSVAPSLGIDVRPISVHGDIERAIAGFARVPNGGLVVAASAAAATATPLELITTPAARHRLPAIAPFKFFVSRGGLMSYGADFFEQFRRAAGYVDRILKGDKPADLPVQAPNKYELAINLKTAKALGITVPPTLIARRRGDRIMSWPDVRFWHKADMSRLSPNVRFWGESGRDADLPECPLLTQSGHAGHLQYGGMPSYSALMFPPGLPFPTSRFHP
jgi:hypothetical protein